MRQIEELDCKGLKILQDDKLYKFTNDAVFLVNTSKVKRGSVVVELCSGGGVVSILVAGKARVKSVLGIEIQSELCDMANESAKLNGQEDVVRFVCDDIKNANKYVENQSVDVVFCNPPYFRVDSGEASECDSRKIARVEVLTNLETVVQVASNILRYGGTFYLVHLASRLQEVLTNFTKYGFALKEMTFCKSRENALPHIVIMRAVKGGKFDCKVNESIVINGENEVFSEMAKKLYTKQSIETD